MILSAQEGSKTQRPVRRLVLAERKDKKNKKVGTSEDGAADLFPTCGKKNKKVGTS
jgi:hypothetical protein